MQASSADSDAKCSRTMYKCVNGDYLEAQQYLDMTRCHGNAAILLRQLNTALSKTPDDPGMLLFSLNTCTALFDWTINSTTLSCIVICRHWESEGARGLRIHGDAANCNANVGQLNVTISLKWLADVAEHRRACWRFILELWTWRWCRISSTCRRGVM